MDFEITPEQSLIRDTARQFAEKEIKPVAARNDRERIFPAAILKEMALLGLMGIDVPEHLGGSAAGSVAYSLALTEIARVCASTAVTMAVTNMVAEAICEFGTDEQKRRFVPPIMRGDHVAAFALSEPGSGSDAASLKSTATREGDCYVLNGTKQFITSGTHAGVTIVMAHTDRSKGARGISAFLVEKGFAGYTVPREEDKMGLRASNTVSLEFEDCRVPASNRLGQEGEGFKVAMTALDGGRIGVAAQAVGIGLAALEASIEYSKQRVQFGQPIAEFQAVQWMLADMATELEAARLMALRAAYLKERGDRRFSKEAAMAKVFASEAANRACTKAIQIHGGYGYTGDFPVERYFRDCRVTTIYEGTSEVQRLVIAREVLREI